MRAWCPTTGSKGIVVDSSLWTIYEYAYVSSCLTFLRKPKAKYSSGCLSFCFALPPHFFRRETCSLKQLLMRGETASLVHFSCTEQNNGFFRRHATHHVSLFHHFRELSRTRTSRRCIKRCMMPLIKGCRRSSRSWRPSLFVSSCYSFQPKLRLNDY